MKKLKGRSIIGVILASIFSTFLGGQSLEFKESGLRENILQIAEHFVRENEWKQAILTYYDFIYRFPQDSLAIIIHYKIVQMYELGNQSDLAEQHLRQIIEKYKDTEYDPENRLRLGLFLYEHHRWEEGLRYAYYQPEPPFKIIMAYNLMRIGEIGLADSVLAAFHDQAGVSVPIYPALHELVVQSARLPWHRKWGALAMSMILPGSGRIYHREYWGGIFQMAGSGALLGVTVYTARHQPQWFLFTGSVTLAYYCVNLYATYQAGERYLAAYKTKQIEWISNEFPLETALNLKLLY